MIEDFINRVKKVKGSRKHSVVNSWGVYDAYRYIRKNKWFDIPRPLSTKEFYKIIREVNKLLANNLNEQLPIKFPHRLGELELRKYPKKITIKDNKLKTNLPIDWKSTLSLWYNDEESYNNRVLIKKECDYIYRIFYNKSNALFTNKTFYQFKPNRQLKINLVNNIVNNNIDAYSLENYDQEYKIYKT